MTNRSSLLVLLPLIASAACSAQGDDTSSRELAYESSPSGPDVDGASMLFEAPAVPSGNTLGTATVHVEGRTAQMGELLGPFPSTSTLDAVVDSKAGENIWGKLGLRLSLDPAERRVISLAGVRPLPRRTIGTAPGLVEFTSGLGRSFFVKAVDERSIDGRTVLPVLEGRYVASWNFFDGVVLEAKAGQVTDLDVNSPAGRRMVTIAQPQRKLPNGCVDGSALANAGFHVTGRSYDRSLTFAPYDREEITIGQNEALVEDDLKVHGGARSDYDFRLELPCVKEPTRVPLGALGAGPTKFQIGRVDVNDVKVTLSSGAVEARRGKFAVFSQHGVNVLSQDWFPTGTGIDLPPGDYTLRILYPTSAGTMEQLEERFSLP